MIRSGTEWHGDIFGTPKLGFITYSTGLFGTLP